MNRRQFLYAGASCAAAVLARSAPSFAAETGYDLIVKGGRVIDPSLRLDKVCDVAVRGNRIAAVDANITAKAATTVDARGKLVVPGLIDVHTHAAEAAGGPQALPADGVTGWIDAGSVGADTIDQGLAVARNAPGTYGLLLNIGRKGIIREGDTKDLANADVDAAKAAIAKHRNIIVGVKARLSANVTGPNDVEVLKRAQIVATSFNLPVMIHMGQSASPLPALVNQLKAGDIVTHLFAPPPNAIIDDQGRILPEVLAARRRGVWFDVGNGLGGHLRWDTVEAILKAGFWPDSISTDWHLTSKKTGVVDMPNCMSKYFGYGMTVPEAIAMGTWHPSRMFPIFRDRGTLNVGAPADIAVLELREGDFDFVDNYKNTIKGKQRLFPSQTVLGGKLVAHA
jgi:dihydroorotase